MLTCDKMANRAALQTGNPIARDKYMRPAISTLLPTAISLSLLLSGCAPATVSNPKSLNIVIDVDRQKIADLSIAVTEQELRDGRYAATWSTQNIEGENYTIAETTLSNDARVTVFFDNKKSWKISTTSSNIRDNFGLGVNSKFSDLERYYPKGKFATGDADGKYATFDTGGPIIYGFDPVKLNATCIDTPVKCVPPQNLPVTQINIYSKIR